MKHLLHARTRVTTLAAITALGLLAPAAAHAATKTVEAGPFGKTAGKTLEKARSDTNAYFRKTITIHRGDSVKWNLNGFHSVTFVPKGKKAPELIVPDPANPLAGINDAAGNPFWFNGQPRLLLNPAAAFPAGGKTFSSSTLENSGLPLDEGRPKPYRLKFNKTGSFKYICVVHPGMGGTVKVVSKSHRVPSTKADKAAASRELNALIKTAKSRSAGPKGLTNTIQIGNDTTSGVAVYDFFPHNATFKAGTTVTIQMSPVGTEDHTLTIGPTNGKNEYIDQIGTNFVTPTPSSAAGPPTLIIDPRAGFPSESPAAGVPAFDGTNHGNGFFNSGVLDSSSATPLARSTKVTFTAPGTYSFICSIHPFMTGKVTITP